MEEREKMITENAPGGQPEITVDRANLYQMKQYTDRKLATITEWIPVDKYGNYDASRLHLFIGTVNIMTPHGPVPIQAEIDVGEAQRAKGSGSALAEAWEKYPGTMQAAIAEVERQARAARQPKIVVPTPAVPGDLAAKQGQGVQG